VPTKGAYYTKDELQAIKDSENLIELWLYPTEPPVEQIVYNHTQLSNGERAALSMHDIQLRMAA
jgi:hypothetical protein